MNTERLDKTLVDRRIVNSRSQAENWIRLGKVTVNGKIAKKTGQFVSGADTIMLTAKEQYVSRAGLKLASVAKTLGVSFANTTVLDVGSSTGGFTDFALQQGAKKVIAVDVGTNQLHQSLRHDSRIELHEKTDIRQFIPDQPPERVVMDVSFISSREILPHLASIVTPTCQLVIMVKPQFEAGKGQTNKGVIKNDTVRRRILHEFEDWVTQYFVIRAKADSQVAGARGNRERFYMLVPQAAATR